MTIEDITIDIMIDALLMKRSLLEEILHELVSIDGLKAFDYEGIGTYEGAHYIQVDKEDIIDLDYQILIGKIKLALASEDTGFIETK